MRTLFSIWIWFFYGLNFFIMMPVVGLAWLLSFPFDKARQFPNYFMFFFGRFMVTINPLWKKTLTGNIPRKITGPVIIVSNHQSFLDMPFEALLPFTVKWIAKKSLFRVPFMGWIMALSGHLSIDRSKKLAVRSIDQQMEPVLRSNVPVHIYAEGTRSKDGRLQPFKSGAFVTAKKLNCTILPMILDGTKDILPSGDWRFNFRGNLKLSLLDPVYPDNFSSIKALRDHVWNIMNDELNRLRQEESRHQAV